MQPFRKLAPFIRPYWIQAILGPLLMVLEVSMDLTQPRLLERIVDVGIAQLDMQLVLRTGGLMVALAFLGALGGVGNTVLAVIVSQSFSADLRSALFRQVQSLSFGNLDELDTGQLVTRLTNDVTQLGQLVLILLRIMVRAPLMLVGSLIMAIVTSPTLAGLLFVLIPILAATLIVVMRRAYPLFLKVQQRLDRLNTILQEYLAGVRVVKAFVRAGHETARFSAANDALRDQTIQVLRLMAGVLPVMMLAVNAGLVGSVWFGGLKVMEGSMQAGQLIAFINYLMRALGEVAMVAMLLVQVSRAQASAERVVEVLDSTARVQDRPQAAAPSSLCGRVCFENVSFEYETQEKPVLRDVSFTAEPGTTVAVLGATGSGKSTLVHLIPRFYDVTTGRVTIDGVDVRDLPQEALRRRVGIALQDAILFSGSIRENIRYGRPEAGDDEVEAAARAAQAHDFIQSLPQGYDTPLGQRGVNLSGGQKQRIAIARALLLHPVILILDDSTSAVDATTESKIQAALHAWMHQRTCFVIAQRISTVLDADKILVLDEGRLAAQGTHAELMAGSPVYREIYTSQLGEGALPGPAQPGEERHA
ncbi:MAG: ABC transporter ATP-binding protein [Chloroflexi bacterium]|nr:ABC transporter ATP-binding protein [Chloroflexota bacterium]